MPTDPQPQSSTPAACDVVRAAIHPAIGVARVGNSWTEYFIGPEVIAPRPETPGSYRDASGALKRQAARFRIYGYNAAGEGVGELSPGDGTSIKWTVHVANRKAAWYQWQMAMDIPEAATIRLPRRNAKVTGEARQGLVIDAGPRTIEGRGTQGAPHQFRGKFTYPSAPRPVTADVYLGEVRTDADGRLLFLGGHGASASPVGSPIFIDGDDSSFINADGWYDDMSDGPVTAEVTIGGRPIPVEPAWVVTAPPDYGPGVVGVRTLYDLLFDLYIQAQWLPAPTRVSFRADVYPILRRLTGLQWVNRGFATQFGWGGPNHFEDPDYVAKLARKPVPGGPDVYGELRRQVLNSFRNPAGTDNNPLPWPWIYGDAMNVPPAETPRQNATVSPTQYRILQAWAAGHFEDDWGDSAEGAHEIDLVALEDRPAMLDRAALEFCLADAFHPGCEVTWPIRHATMFSAPYRIRHRPAGVPDPDYGPTLTQAVVLSAGGPLNAQGPGDLTRWMGLPWQADTGFCRSGYDTEYDPYVPTFWPARVPNQVLTKPNYDIAVDPSRPRDLRLRAFTSRMTWTAPLTGNTAGQMEEMVRIFGDMGLVEVRPGVADDPDLPPSMMVASFGPSIVVPEPPREAAAVAAAPPGPAAVEAPEEALRRRALREAGWDSEEQRDGAPLPVRHPK